MRDREVRRVLENAGIITDDSYGYLTCGGYELPQKIKELREMIVQLAWELGYERNCGPHKHWYKRKK